MAKRKHNFVIGYKKGIAKVYGKFKDARSTFAIPLTLLQAKRKVKPMMCAGMVIYELIELKGQ